MRPGSSFARTLFGKTDESEWLQSLESYDQAIISTANIKSISALIGLDKWWRTELRATVEGRPEKYITKDELFRVMQWKLGRGKDRPMLLNLIQQNTEISVIEISKEAMQMLHNNDWKGSMICLMRLRGVGPATASAILANFDPLNCPFMADEVIEASTNKKRDYTMKVYENMRKILIEKLRSFNNQFWNSELLGRALWAKSVLCDKTVLDNGSTENLRLNKKRKIDSTEPRIKETSVEKTRPKRAK